MRDYLVLFPKLVPLGGAEAATAWILQLLSELGEVTLLTWEPPNFADLDRVFGTELRHLGIKVVLADSKIGVRLSTLSFLPRYLQFRLFVLAARRLRATHRHCISAMGDLDLGKPAVQYLHGAPVNHRAYNIDGQSSPFMRLVAKLYVKFCDLLIPWQEKNIAGNFTLANSAWTSREFARVYGREVDAVVFPPPLGRPQNRPNQNSLNRFLAISRVHEDKGLLDVIEIVRSLRNLGHEVGLSLYLIPFSASLMRQLEHLAAANSDWLSLHIKASREELDQAICEHRFGLHGSPHESYGMAVAEMVLGHCLTAVYDHGGQTEIVTEPELRFGTRDVAVAKLDRILSDPLLENSLRSSQAQRCPRYSQEQFVLSFGECMDRVEQGTEPSKTAGETSF